MATITRKTTRPTRPVVALSIRQPWAWLIVNGHKPVENRDWPTNFRGRFLVHAGKSVPDAFEVRDIAKKFGVTIPPLNEMAYGAFVGWSEVVDCVDHHESPYFFGDYGFVLANSAPLAAPVPFRGSLGFFHPRLSASELEAVGKVVPVDVSVVG